MIAKLKHAWEEAILPAMQAIMIVIAVIVLGDYIFGCKYSHQPQTKAQQNAFIAR